MDNSNEKLSGQPQEKEEPSVFDEFGFKILFEQNHLLVVSKPGGLSTQSPPGIDSLEVRLRRWIAAQHPGADAPYISLPHRIDRPASGALLVAKSLKMRRKLGKFFERRQIKKSYQVLVEGKPDVPEGTWRDTMRKIPGVAASEIVTADHPDAQTAILEYKLKESRTTASGEVISLLEIQLETGRTHQIRLQASCRNLPVLGDAQYGSQIPFGPQEADQRKRHIALHAYQLELTHPLDKDVVQVTAPLPETWSEVWSGALPT